MTGLGSAAGNGVLDVSARDDLGPVVRVSLRDLTDEWTVYFAGPDIDQRVDDDFLVPLALLPCMARGLDLALPFVRSARLLSGLPRLQQTFASWFPGFRPATVTIATGPPTAPTRVRPLRTVALFSGGVDSFYTVLTESSRIDALLFVSGFDLALGRPEEPDRDYVVDTLRAAAGRLGLPLLHIRTNVRAFSDRWLLWGDHYVGSGLATVALMLSGVFDELLIPATHSNRDHFPYGTHPQTDPLWSTERMRLRVHGLQTSRPAKVAEISRSTVALDTLRVCWENWGGAYNCGTCEKCQRTMLELYLASALDRCATLPHTVDLDAVAAMPVPDASRRSFVIALLRAAERSNRPMAPAIRTALTVALGRP